MLPFTLSSLLSRHRTAGRRPPRTQEPADMGTAFGMEQWLDERDHGIRPAPKAVAAPAAAGPFRWLPRWLLANRLLRARP